MKSHIEKLCEKSDQSHSDHSSKDRRCQFASSRSLATGCGFARCRRSRRGSPSLSSSGSCSWSVRGSDRTQLIVHCLGCRAVPSVMERVGRKRRHQEGEERTLRSMRSRLGSYTCSRFSHSVSTQTTVKVSIEVTYK